MPDASNACKPHKKGANPMYLADYFVFILALLACMVFSMNASGKERSA